MSAGSALPVHPMLHGVLLGPVQVWTRKQEAKLGELLAAAVGEGRAVEIENEERSILVLMGPADDTGLVYRIDEEGEAPQVGVTVRIQ